MTKESISKIKNLQKITKLFFRHGIEGSAGKTLHMVLDKSNFI